MVDETPSRRSKTPIPTADVPPTPSRIPVPPQSTRQFSSFASPTKASLARHNPQLLPRAKSIDPDIRTSANKGRLQDVFDRALGNTPQGARGRAASGEARPTSDRNNGTPSRTPTRARSVGGGMASKPRRLSRSPSKRPPTTAETPRSNFKPATAFENIQGIANPFQKKGLRRSPIPGQSSQVTAGSLEEQIQEDVNPFKKTGLRRSPIPTAAPMVAPTFTEPVETGPTPVEEEPVSTTPKDPVPTVTSTFIEPVEIEATPAVHEPFSTTPKDPVPSQLINPFNIEVPKQTEKVVIRSKGIETVPLIDTAKPSAITEAMPAVIQGDDSNAEESFDLGAPTSANEIVSTTPKDPVPQARQPLVTLEPEIQELVEPTQSVELPQFEEPEEMNFPVPEIDPLISESSPSTRKSQQLKSTHRQQPAPTKQPAQTFKRPRPEEPELPLTPTQRGIADPIVTTPPVGIHDTPSKTARRNKALGHRLKSSPLKPRAEPPQEAESQPEPPAKRRKSARFSLPHDPHAEKKKIRDALLLEIQQLQADVSLANQENERIRLHNESKKPKPSRPPNSDELLALLLRSTAIDNPEPKSKPLSALKATSLFLPFSARRKPQQILPIEKSLPSHLPIPLDDPLPYLQLFSPLTYKSDITLLPPESTSSDESIIEIPMATLQHHQISTSHPSGFFAARLSMIVDTSSLTISSLDIDRLDPNAESELGPFVRQRAKAEGPIGKDIGTICWAMSRWTEVSISRAKFWCDVERDFGTSEARRNTLKNLGKRKRKRRSVEADEDGQGDEEEGGRKWTRKELFGQMGRTSMDIKGDDVEIRVEWKVGFDWIGDVESHMDVDLELPSAWHEQDDRNSLGKVRDMFKKLVKDKGPLGAVRTVVGLVMAES